jgi:hypothetical protein
MRRAIACALSSTLLALLGCDPEGDPPDDGVEFREDVGYIQVRTQSASFTIKGCDPPWGDWGPAAPTPDGDEKEWAAMMELQGRMVADETLLATFMAQPDVEEFCASSCKKVGAKWDGGAEIMAVDHAFGEIEITGECPYGTVATGMPADSKADIACTCQ